MKCSSSPPARPHAVRRKAAAAPAGPVSSGDDASARDGWAPPQRWNGASVRSVMNPTLSMRSSPGATSSGATEPTRGSASSGATSRSRKSGRASTSLFIITTTSPAPAAAAALHATA
jgi:hypothetical protein